MHTRFRRSRSGHTDAGTTAEVEADARFPTIVPKAWRRFAVAALVVAGAAAVVDATFNDKKSGALSSSEKSYLNECFMHAGAGLVLTAVVGKALFRSGFAHRVISANPWVFLGVGLAASLGSITAVLYTAPENKTAKYLSWLAFNASQAATLSPLFFFNAAVLSRAALYTCGLMGALAFVGATANNERYLYVGGPVLAGIGVVALSSLAPLIVPFGVRFLTFTEALSIYGGLGLFGFITLVDVQKILCHARMAELGLRKKDAVEEAVSLELDFLNLFIRLVQPKVLK